MVNVPSIGSNMIIRASASFRAAAVTSSSRSLCSWGSSRGTSREMPTAQFIKEHDKVGKRSHRIGRDFWAFAQTNTYSPSIGPPRACLQRYPEKFPHLESRSYLFWIWEIDKKPSGPKMPRHTVTRWGSIKAVSGSPNSIPVTCLPAMSQHQDSVLTCLLSCKCIPLR